MGYMQRKQVILFINVTRIKHALLKQVALLPCDPVFSEITLHINPPSDRDIPPLSIDHLVGRGIVLSPPLDYDSVKTGLVPRQKLEELDLKDVADDLERAGRLPTKR
jgi:hypothetical protein